jgi:hypothetical protein
MKGDSWDNTGESKLVSELLRKDEEGLLDPVRGSLTGSLREICEFLRRPVATELGVNDLDVLLSASF